MSTIPSNLPTAAVVGGHHADDAHGNHHDPHLAHHFDTPEQQYNSNKLGMWVFLGTEILMFGGLFCAYSVYRHNHPEIFVYAHAYLDKWLGALNTVILITSSLSMAWGVRAAQMGKTRFLAILLVITLLGGAGFMVIKTIEYHKKWEHHLFVGGGNVFYNENAPKKVKSSFTPGELEEEALGEAGTGAEHPTAEGNAPHNAESPVSVNPAPQAAGGTVPEQHPEAGHVTSHAAATTPTGPVVQVGASVPDGNEGSKDGPAAIKPPDITPAGLAAPVVAGANHHHLEYDQLADQDRRRVYTFFGIYFVMTGLHGLHVLIGMSLIFWVLVRCLPPSGKIIAPPIGLACAGAFVSLLALIAGNTFTIILGLVIAAAGIGWLVKRLPARTRAKGEAEFGPTYFYPVDLVGLYWHLVDLIWIFLFPLLYLIH